MQTIARSAPGQLPNERDLTQSGPAPDRTSSGSRSSSTAALIFLGAISLWVALLAAARPFDPMGWSHAALGRLIGGPGSLPSGDPFSWAAVGKSGLLDGWLYDVVVARLTALGGGTSLTSLLTLALVPAVAVTTFVGSRRLGAYAWPASIAATLATLLLRGFIAERPQMFSYLLFGLLLLLLEPALRGSKRALGGLVVIVVLWANIHLAFTVGVGVVGLVAVGYAFATRTVRRPIVTVAAVVLAGLATPYGIRVYLVPFEARGSSQIIQEWRHWSAHQSYDLILLGFLVLAAVACMASGRWRRPDVVLPMLALSVLTLDAIRNAPFLVLFAAPELALGLTALIGHVSRRASLGERGRFRIKAITHGAVAGALVLLCVAAVRVDTMRSAGIEAYPVRAVERIPDGCRVLNEDRYGGLVASRRFPSVTVSQDGRQVEGVASLLAQQRVLDARPGWRSWLDRHDVDCVLARPDRPILDELDRVGWKRRAADPSGVLYVRSRSVE